MDACDVGAVHAARTALSIAATGTGRSANARTVRRPVTADWRARSVPREKRSSSLGRTRSRAMLSPPACTPRTTATGVPPVLPLTRSAAAAISSATATWVISSGWPRSSVVPRRSSITVTPAAPMQKSVTPSRHGRPAVSVITTPTSVPVCSAIASRSAAALASGSRGRRSGTVVLERSMPAAAITMPRWFSTIRRSPRSATVRTVSAAIASSRSSTHCPSTLLTIFELTTRMSPSAIPCEPSGHCTWTTAAASVLARSTLWSNCGSPGTATACIRSPTRR